MHQCLFTAISAILILPATIYYVWREGQLRTQRVYLGRLDSLVKEFRARDDISGFAREDIEKELRLPFDRRFIAFYVKNRLLKRHPLESKPTSAQLLRFKGELAKLPRDVQQLVKEIIVTHVLAWSFTDPFLGIIFRRHLLASAFQETQAEVAVERWRPPKFDLLLPAPSG
jgi:hypothetical protein